VSCKPFVSHDGLVAQSLLPFPSILVRCVSLFETGTKSFISIAWLGLVLTLKGLHTPISTFYLLTLYLAAALRMGGPDAAMGSIVLALFFFPVCLGEVARLAATHKLFGVILLIP